MIIRALDENGDWTFGRGKSDYKQDQEALKQNIDTKLKEWVGDCFFNQNAGINWQTRLAAGNQKDRLEQEISSLILKVDGVVNVALLTVEVANRKFTVNYEIETIYSQEAQRLIEQNIITIGT